jgi:hypothetical protein
LDVFYGSAWFFRLLAIGAYGTLAVIVFRKRWVGTVVMLAALGVILTSTTISNHGHLSAMIFIPIGLAEVVRLVNRSSLRICISIALVSVALGATHVGLWVVFVICTAPTLIACTVLRILRTQLWLPAAIATVALLSSLPFILITALLPNDTAEQQGSLWMGQLRTAELGGLRFSFLDPLDFLWILPVTAIVIVQLLRSKPTSSSYLVLGSIFFTSCFFMFAPLELNPLSKWLPFWLMRRGHYIVRVIGYIAVAGGLAAFVLPLLRTRKSRLAFAAVVLCSIPPLFQSSFNVARRRTAMERQRLAEIRRLRSFLPVLPGRPLVAADPELSLYLPAVQLTSVLAPEPAHGNPADVRLMERYRDGKELLDRGTSVERRRQIVSQHKVAFLLTRAGSCPPGLEEIADAVVEDREFALLRIKPVPASKRHLSPLQ